MTESGLGDVMRKRERKNGTGEIKSKTLRRAINQFKKVFPWLPESARFIKGARRTLIS